MGTAGKAMAAHRLLAVLLVMVIGGVMAAGGDGDYLDGGSVVSLDSVGTSASDSTQQGGILVEGGPEVEPSVEGVDSGPYTGELESDPDPPATLPTPKDKDGKPEKEELSAPTFYNDCDYKGWKVPLKESVEDVKQVTSGGGAISSFKIPAGWEVKIFSEPLFKGEAKQFKGNVECLPYFNWDSPSGQMQVKSVQIFPPPQEAKEESPEEQEVVNQKEAAKRKEELKRIVDERAAMLKLHQDMAADDKEKEEMLKDAQSAATTAEAKVKAKEREVGSARSNLDEKREKYSNAVASHNMVRNEKEVAVKKETEKKSVGTMAK